MLFFAFNYFIICFTFKFNLDLSSSNIFILISLGNFLIHSFLCSKGSNLTFTGFLFLFSSSTSFFSKSNPQNSSFIFFGFFEFWEELLSILDIFEFVLLDFDFDCWLDFNDFEFWDVFSFFESDNSSSSSKLLLLELLSSNFSFNFYYKV